MFFAAWATADRVQSSNRGLQTTDYEVRVVFIFCSHKLPFVKV